ncbi:MAG: beta-N-acetylhexosaminidase [Gemmatimonadaceae bacterium]
MPASLVMNAGTPFDINRNTGIAVEGSPEATQIGEALATMMRTPTGFPFVVTSLGAMAPPNSIVLRLAGDRTALGEEGYELSVTADSMVVTANRPAGLFHGMQTIRQLLPAEIESEIGVARSVWAIPALKIVDVPRFAWRGAMLDVARHFFTVREVQQYIDILALYKLNVLHLSLTNDQGWRIAINSRPKLASMGASTQVGGGPGGFYTQQDYQDIVRYAQTRYITVVPEIDMPGHTNAALVAYPELSCSTRPTAPFTGIDVGWSTFCVDNEDTYALADDVIREVAAITPGAYLHVGGDEVHALTRDQYAKFVERVQAIVTRYGKKMIGWEEITKARLIPTTIAQQWRTDSAATAIQYGAKLVLSPGPKAYFDMKYNDRTELGLKWAGLIEVRDAYEWDPATYLKGVSEDNIVGVEAPVWSETLQNISAVEYMAMPRLPALAEVGWTPQSGRDWESFRMRLAAQAPRWHYLGINYYRSPQVPW